MRSGSCIVASGYTLLLVFTPAMANAAADFHASISGTVTNALTGESLRKAYVRLRPTPGTEDIRPTVTDEKGRFNFESVPPGRYSRMLQDRHPETALLSD